MLLRIPLIISTILFQFDLMAQPFPQPESPDTCGFGKYIGRTMHLLHNSDPNYKKTLKILVYGQSISEQDWWLEVRSDLTARFPNANIIMENRAIGGFSTQILYKTVESDVVSFSPDLVLLYDYGSNIYYDSILSTIRSRTTDGQHLNDGGNFLMAELIKAYLYCNPAFVPDPDHLLTRYCVGKDVGFTGDTMTLLFSGNRVDVLTATGGFSKADSARILIRAGDAEEGGDWHLKRSFKVLKTRVHPGDTIHWKTYSVCTDVYIPGQMTQQSVENVTTLFQGVENTSHTLQIIRSGESKPPIKEIRVYRPFWNRL